MDREIPKQVRQKALLKKWGIAACCAAVLCIILSLVFSSLGDSVKQSDISISRADRGVLESSVAASGRIVPLYEQIIVSPVATRIMEVYCNEGDHVEAGQSLLKLDLQSTEADLRRAGDEVAMKNNELEQTALSNNTGITDLEMKIKVKEMSVSHLKAEVANERRLDSIGSGTGDRIRQAELACSTGLLELDQLRKQLENERKMRRASYRSKQLEGSISERNMREISRMLDDARVKAPRQGTVTWLNKTLGSSIGAGEKLAVVSDLSHFRIDGEIPESSSGKLSVGAPVNIRINRNYTKGRIGSISPQSQNGMVTFSVFIDDDSNPILRSGLRTELNVSYDSRDGVVRIKNGPYFQGAGTYKLFVKTSGNHLESRDVTLGDSNFDFVEVIRGISPGEEVVVSDLSALKNKKSLKIK